MAGIAGIVSLKKGYDVTHGFDALLQGLQFEVFEQTFHIEKEGCFKIGVIHGGNVSEKRYFADETKTIECIVEGRIFISDELERDLREECRFDANVRGEACLPYLCLKKGNAFVEQVTGWFNVLVVDHRNGEITLHNSRYGMLPLYYVRTRDSLVFCSKLAPLVTSGLVPLAINKTAVLETLLFNYTIGNHTTIEGVQLLPAASVIRVAQSTCTVGRYWNHQELFHQEMLPFRDSIDLLHETFCRLIRKYAEGAPIFGVSLTGGWDGRLVLSYLTDIPRAKYFLYSFGSKGFSDIEIPLMLSQALGYDYEPIYLGEEYVRDRFFSDAVKTVLCSDGNRSFATAHYMYAMSRLHERTNLILSGNCGSNIIKTVCSTGPVSNQNIKTLFSSFDVARAARKVFNAFRSRDIMSLDESDFDRFEASIRESEILNDRSYSANERFYHFLLSNIERKYFGAEIASYASLVQNYSAFIDHDFVQAVIRTPFFGGHYPFFTSNMAHRRKTSQLYAILIGRNSKPLADFMTDRGFPLSSYGSIRGNASILINKLRKGFHKVGDEVDGYRLGQTAREFALSHHARLPRDLFMVDTIESVLRAGNGRDAAIERAVSWSLWYDHVKGTRT